jgi:hypothetical protein
VEYSRTKIMKQRSQELTSPNRISGTVTSRTTRAGPAPAIRAASSSSGAICDNEAEISRRPKASHTTL